MTGRAAGYCAGADRPGYANPMAGRGLGRGYGGRGRGWGGGGFGRRNMFHATGQPGWVRFGTYNRTHQMPEPEQEKQFLIEQARALQTELEFIKKRLDAMEETTTTK
jgi:hypothetical protein